MGAKKYLVFGLGKPITGTIIGNMQTELNSNLL